MPQPHINPVQRARERLGAQILVPRRASARLAVHPLVGRSSTLRQDAVWTLWHVLIALGIQAGLFVLTSSWWAGAAAASALFIGREHAQAEYRWIQQYGGGLRRNMPWWGGFDRRLWDRHAMCGWMVPLAVAVAVAVIAP